MGASASLKETSREIQRSWKRSLSNTQAKKLPTHTYLNTGWEPSKRGLSPVKGLVLTSEALTFCRAGQGQKKKGRWLPKLLANQPASAENRQRISHWAFNSLHYLQ